MAYAGSQHQTANDIQKLLISSIQDPNTEGKDKAQLARAWEALERLKREMRGIAPLKAVEPFTNLKRLPRAPAADAPIEIHASAEPSKESIKNSFFQTVTTPPTGDGISAGEVIDNIPTTHHNP